MKDRKRVPWKDCYRGFIRLMGQNGWTWKHPDPDMEEYYKFTNTFLSDSYHVKVQAIVFSDWKHIGFNGYLGVCWLEAIEYPDCTVDENNGVTIEDCEDIISGIIAAEENLVRLGVPFCPDYLFHGSNKANMKRRNDATRKRLNMERWEAEIEETAKKKSRCEGGNNGYRI